MIPLRKRHIDEGQLKKQTELEAAQKPSSRIGEHEIIPQFLFNGTDLRTSSSRHSSSSDSTEDAPEDEAVFNMYRVNVPYFISNFDCNPVTSVKSTADLIHIFQCTADKSYDEDEKTFWSQFNVTDGEKSTIRGPPAIPSQQEDCDIQNLCVSIFDYIFGGGDSAYNHVSRSQSVGNVPVFHSAELQQRRVHPKHLYRETTAAELTAFEVTFSEIEDITLEHAFTRIEKRRKWPFGKQSKTHPAPDDAQFKSGDFSKKLTIIETAESISVEVPEVIFTSTQRASQKPSKASEATNAVAVTVPLDDEDKCYSETPATHAIVTPEKSEPLESNENEVEEHVYQPKPILRSTSAKNRHLLVTMKLTPEKSFHFTDNVPDDTMSSSSYLVSQKSNHHSDPIMTSQDQQPIQAESLNTLPSKVDEKNDYNIQQEEVKEHNDSSVILDDLREEQKKHPVKVEGDAVTIASNVSAWSSAQRQKYLSLLSGTEEDSDHSYTRIKKERLEQKVKKVLLMFAEKQAQLESSVLMDKSFMINDESTIEEQSNEESFNDFTPTVGLYNTAIQPNKSVLCQGISDWDVNKHDLYSSSSGLEKNQASLINFILKPPNDDSYPFNYTRAANYRQVLVDHGENSRQGSHTTDEKVKNRNTVVVTHDTVSSLHSSQDPCISILNSQQNKFLVPSICNAATINKSFTSSLVKQKGITFPTIRIKSLTENLERNPGIFSAPFTVLSKPSVMKQQPIISNDDLLFVRSTQSNGKSYDSVGDDSTVETSNLTASKKYNKVKIHRLKNVPPLSTVFGRSSVIPFSVLEDDDGSEQEAIYPLLGAMSNVPLEKELFSETSSSHGDISVGIVDDNDSNSNPLHEEYWQENIESFASDRHGKFAGEKPNVPEVTAGENISTALPLPKDVSRRHPDITPDVTIAERLNTNPTIPKQREKSDGEQSVHRRVMIEACEMSIISEMSATSKSTSKYAHKEKIVANLQKNNPESRLDLFLSANKENDPSKINATQSVRTGSYSVATERAKIHSRFVDETKGQGWVETMKKASSGEWKPNGGWIDMNDDLYRKCFADESDVGMRSRSRQLQSQERTEKEDSSQLIGNAITKPDTASTTGFTLSDSIKDSGFNDYVLTPNFYQISSPNRCVDADATPVVFTNFETIVDAQDPIPLHTEKNEVSHHGKNTHSFEPVTKTVAPTSLAVKFSARRGPITNVRFGKKMPSSGLDPVSTDVAHEPSLQMRSCDVQFQEQLDASAEKSVWFDVESQFPSPPPPPPPKSRLPKKKQVVFEYDVQESDEKKIITQEKPNGEDGLALAASSVDMFSATDIKTSDPLPESSETVGFSTVGSNENTESSRNIDDSSHGNSIGSSNLIDFVKCGVRGELPSAHLDFLRRGKESSESQPNSKSRFHSFTSTMFSCGSSKAFLNTIQENEEETKEATEADGDGLRIHNFQEKNINIVTDEVSDTSRDTLSQFFKDELKEPHRWSRVRLERLAAKRVDTMINSSFSEEYKRTSINFS